MAKSLFSLVAVCATASELCEPLEGIDCFGEDIGKVDNIGSAGDCCNLCTGHGGCRAWSWDGASDRGCYLKSGCSNRVVSGATSGVQSVSDICSPHSGIDCVGDDLQKIENVGSAGECCDACKGHGGCSVWSWDEASDKGCYLKSACNNPISSGTISGSASPLGRSFSNPINMRSADPFITYVDGNYLLVMTGMRNDVTVQKAPSLNGLKTAPWVSVFNTGAFYESAEIYKFGGRWYIYYTHYPNSIMVIESENSDPQSQYHTKAQLTGNTYDATLLFMKDGSRYLVSSTYGSIVIQQMSDPWTMQGGAATIAVVDQPWESAVVEAPQQLWHGNDLFVVYSSGVYNMDNYGSSVLKWNGGNVMDKGSWKKLPGPLFRGDLGAHAYAAGVVSPFLSPDRTEYWMTYSAYLDTNVHVERSIRAQPFGWKPDGTPNFGSPIALGQGIKEPSGTLPFLHLKSSGTSNLSLPISI